MVEVYTSAFKQNLYGDYGNSVTYKNRWDIENWKRWKWVWMTYTCRSCSGRPCGVWKTTMMVSSSAMNSCSTPHHR